MSKARQKGTQYENHVRDTYLRGIWPDVERSPLMGTYDWGDFINTSGWCIEARNRARWDIPGWIRGIYGRFRTRKAALQTPWCIVFKADKRSDLKEDYVVAPAWLFFELVRQAKEKQDFPI